MKFKYLALGLAFVSAAAFANDQSRQGETNTKAATANPHNEAQYRNKAATPSTSHETKHHAHKHEGYQHNATGGATHTTTHEAVKSADKVNPAEQSKADLTPNAESSDNDM